MAARHQMFAAVLAGAYKQARMERPTGDRQDIIHAPIIDFLKECADGQTDPHASCLTVLFWVRRTSQVCVHVDFAFAAVWTGG